MAFDIRCPECQTKLRLDEAPDPDTPIECPRCGSQFSAPAAEKPKKKPKAGKAADGKAGGKKGKKRVAGAPRKRKAKKKKTNVFVLFAAIIAGFAGLIAVGCLMVYFVNRAGKVEEMLSFVPDSCNWARGVNVSQLAKYPGYKNEVDKFVGPVKSASDELAKAAGQDPEEFIDYLVLAKNVGGGRGTLYVIRTGKSYKPEELGKNLQGAQAQGAGSYKMPARAPGVLAGATVSMPTKRIIVIAPPGMSAGGGGKDGTWKGQLDTTSKLVIRGSIWLLVRAAGGEKNYITSTAGTVAADFKVLDDKAKRATTFGVWTTPGGSGVRVGAAMQCASSDDAKELIKNLREGPVGKEDESVPPNSLKQAFSPSSDNKAWTEFMQYCSFRQKGECAYLTSKVENPENVKRYMDLFNSVTMGTGETQTFGFGGGPPGMTPPGASSQGPPGMPGGVVTPGMGPMGPGR